MWLVLARACSPENSVGAPLRTLEFNLGVLDGIARGIEAEQVAPLRARVQKLEAFVHALANLATKG